MLFQTYGDRRNPAVLFFHAMGVTGASSEPIARYLQDRYFCILPTSTVYCEGQKIPGTEDLKPYITAKDKGKKWLFGTIGMAVISAALAAIMSVFIH